MKKVIIFLGCLLALPSVSSAAYSLGLANGTNCNDSGADKCVALIGTGTETFGVLYDRTSDSTTVGYAWPTLAQRFDFFPYSTSLNFFDGGTWAAFDVELIATNGSADCSGMTRTQCEAVGAIVGCVSYPGGVYQIWTLESCSGTVPPSAPSLNATSTLDSISFSLTYANALLTSVLVAGVIFGLFALFS